MYLIDTHSHLSFEAFKGDYREVVERAFKNNVRGIITIGSNYENSARAVKIAKEYQVRGSTYHPLIDTDMRTRTEIEERTLKEGKVFAAVGLHPIHVSEGFSIEKFKTLASQEEVVALGETGVDRFKGEKEIDLQREVFLKTLKLAHQVQKPIILHCREAAADLYPWLLATGTLPKGVWHFFSESWKLAEQVLDLGFLLSFTGLLTFSKNQNLIEVVKKTPLPKIMLETDSPFVVPEPYRSKGILRNEPAFVGEVGKAIAKIKNVSYEKVVRTTTENAIKLFKLK